MTPSTQDARATGLVELAEKAGRSAGGAGRASTPHDFMHCWHARHAYERAYDAARALAASTKDQNDDG